MKKPEIFTHSDVVLEYLFSTLVEEQKKTNELLERLLNSNQKIEEKPKRRVKNEPLGDDSGNLKTSR